MNQSERHTTPTLADFELLAEVSQLLTVTDLDDVLEQVINLSARAVGAEQVSMFLHHQYSDQWQRLLTSRELDQQQSVKIVHKVVEDGLAGWVVREKRGTIVADTLKDDRWHHFPDDPLKTRSALCVPVLQTDRVLAILTVTHSQPGQFNEHHLRLMTIIANQIVVAVRNAQLFDQMQEQQHQLEAILQAIPDILMVVNEDGEILLVNGAARRLLDKIAPDTLVGMSLSDLFSIETALQPLEIVLSRSVFDTNIWSFESRSERQLKDYLTNVSTWRNPTGATAGNVIVMHDVTSLRDLNRFKDVMIKLVDHDLRNGLSLILGYTELIRSDLPDEATESKDYLNVISARARWMNELLDDLVRVEKVRNSPIELHEPIDFSLLMTKVFDKLNPQAKQKQHTLEIDPPPQDLPAIIVDPVLIRETIENLVTNAIKYTPPGGHIVMRALTDDKYLYFSVRDTGIGVALEDIPHLFESGFRAEQPEGINERGWGIGLSLVKNIIERHEGEVWVQSEQGVGSEFGFWLPLDRDPHR